MSVGAVGANGAEGYDSKWSQSLHQTFELPRAGYQRKTAYQGVHFRLSEGDIHVDFLKKGPIDILGLTCASGHLILQPNLS